MNVSGVLFRVDCRELRFKNETLTAAMVRLKMSVPLKHFQPKTNQLSHFSSPSLNLILDCMNQHSHEIINRGDINKLFNDHSASKCLMNT